jgi:hypothetical protein
VNGLRQPTRRQVFEKWSPPSHRLGKDYYVNMRTKQSSWEPPPELQAVQPTHPAAGVRMSELASRQSASRQPSPPPQRRSLELRPINSAPALNSRMSWDGNLAVASQEPRRPASAVISSIVSSMGQEGSSAGVGIFLEQHDVGGPVLVKTIFKGTSAERCGKIAIGDEIVSVNGQLVEGRSPNSLRTVIVGQTGTTISLGFRKAGVGISLSIFIHQGSAYDVKLVRGSAEFLAAIRYQCLNLYS